MIAQVFDYGVVNQLCDVNPASQFQLKALNLPDVLTNTNPIKGSKPRSKSVDVFLVLTS